MFFPFSNLTFRSFCCVCLRCACFITFVSFRLISLCSLRCFLRGFINLLERERERERDIGRESEQTDTGTREREMPFSDYTKRRAMYFHGKGLLPPAIVDALAAKGIRATRQGILKLLKRIEHTGSFKRCPGSGRLSKITPQIKASVQAQMREDDETMATQLEVILRRQGFKLSRSTILRSRVLLGWTFRGSTYCQTIRKENKEK